jgi:hypothetical protein
MTHSDLTYCTRREPPCHICDSGWLGQSAAVPPVVGHRIRVNSAKWHPSLQHKGSTVAQDNGVTRPKATSGGCKTLYCWGENLPEHQLARSPATVLQYSRHSCLPEHVPRTRSLALNISKLRLGVNRRCMALVLFRDYGVTRPKATFDGCKTLYCWGSSSGRKMPSG